MKKKKGVRIIALLFLAVLIPLTFTAGSASGADVGEDRVCGPESCTE